MNCPSCGSRIDSPGRFCAECGAPLEPGPPPLESTAASPSERDWEKTPPPPPPQEREHASKVTNWNPSARRPAGPSPAAGGFGGLIALAGAALAIASAWMPWWMAQSNPLDVAAWGQPVDVADGLANGRYLLAAAAVAALSGLLLVIRLGRNRAMLTILALLALAGAAGIGMVEFFAYRKLQDLPGTGLASGWGLYAGIAGAAVAALGAVVALFSRPRRAGATVGSRTLLGLTAVAAAGMLMAAATLVWPQLSGAEVPAVAAASASPAAPSTPLPSTTAQASPAPASAAPTGQASSSVAPSQAPESTFLTAGYPSPEQAISQFVSDQGYTYAGPCGAAIASSDYCSQFIGSSLPGRVYAIGGMSSEADVWLLLRQSGSQWFVVEAASASNGSPPPWH